MSAQNARSVFVQHRMTSEGGNLASRSTSNANGTDDLQNRSQWIPLHSDDGAITLYFDQQTQNIWRLDSDSGSTIDMDMEGAQGDGHVSVEDHVMDENAAFIDEDIDIASRIADGSDYDTHAATVGQPLRPDPRTPRSIPGLSSLAPHVPVLDDTSGGVQYSFQSAPCEHPIPPSGSSRTQGQDDRESTPFPCRGPPVGSNSDTEGPARFTATQKGKGRGAGAGVNEEMMDVPNFSGGDPTPAPRDENRSATVDDILRLGEMIHRGQQEMARYIVDGLRRNRTQFQSNRTPAHDFGNEGDIEDEDEDEGDGRVGRERGRKARSPLENLLSAKIREHMKFLIDGKGPATAADLEHFDPLFGSCCNAANFQLYLAGTPCDRWNKSAASVFVESFLGKYTEYSSADDAVVDMVKFKTHSTIAAMIRRYRVTGPGGQVDAETRRYQSRQERKRKLFHRRRNLTFFYPLLAPQRPMLDELGADGMSSDEERTTGPVREYDISVPAWRSAAVTSWLRVFDILYTRARRDGVFRDSRGSYPRTRVTEENATVSRSLKFVSRLPLNAYDEGWLHRQVDVNNVVRPRPPVNYYHDPRVIELAHQTMRLQSFISDLIIYVFVILTLCLAIFPIFFSLYIK